MKTIFKIGDIVYDSTTSEGKGKVVEINLKKSTPILVRFDNDIEVDYTLDGRLFEDSPKLLSFTPYKLEINQERPIELPEVGEEIMVSDRGTSWFLRQFVEYKKDLDYPVVVQNDNNCYKYFKRLR